MGYWVFVKDLVDCSATTHRVIFAKYIAQITKQQSQYTVGHPAHQSGRQRMDCVRHRTSFDGYPLEPQAAVRLSKVDQANGKRSQTGCLANPDLTFSWTGDSSLQPQPGI
jgi:hypothetical protein